MVDFYREMELDKLLQFESLFADGGLLVLYNAELQFMKIEKIKEIIETMMSESNPFTFIRFYYDRNIIELTNGIMYDNHIRIHVNNKKEFKAIREMIKENL